MDADKIKELKRLKKEIINDDDELNTTNLYEVNTDKVLANVLEHQKANVMDPGNLNRNRSKTIRSPFLHNLPAVEGQSSIKPVSRIKLMPIGKAQQQKSKNAGAAAELHEKMRAAYSKSANGSPVNLNTPPTKRINVKNSPVFGGRGRGRKTRRRRPSKASRKI
jgi:hypothetical protein